LRLRCIQRSVCYLPIFRITREQQRAFSLTDLTSILILNVLHILLGLDSVIFAKSAGMTLLKILKLIVSDVKKDARANCGKKHILCGRGQGSGAQLVRDFGARQERVAHGQ